MLIINEVFHLSTEAAEQFFFLETSHLAQFFFSGNLVEHSIEVLIHDTNTQPASPIKFRRDQTRTLVASFNLENLTSEKASFYWKINQLVLSPFSISDEPELLIHDTLELNIGPKLLSAGIKMVTFEVQVAGVELASRDFAFLELEKSALVASIAGGSEVIRSIKGPISVDASSSYDPETEAETSLGIAYNWSCFIITQNNVSGIYNPVPNVIFSGSQSTFNTLVDSAANGTLFKLQDEVFLYSIERGKVALDTRKLISNQTYYVLLTVRKDNRTSSAVQTLHIRNGEIVEIRIR